MWLLMLYKIIWLKTAVLQDSAILHILIWVCLKQVYEKWSELNFSSAYVWEVTEFWMV